MNFYWLLCFKRSLCTKAHPKSAKQIALIKALTLREKLNILAGIKTSKMSGTFTSALDSI